MYKWHFINIPSLGNKYIEHRSAIWKKMRLGQKKWTASKQSRILSQRLRIIRLRCQLEYY